MRGSPPFQLALLLLGFFVLGVPLVQLTRGRPAPMTARPAAVPSAEASRPVLIRVRYVNQPQTLSVKVDGKELLPRPAPGTSPMEARTAFVIPQEGVELHVQATWPAGGPEMPVTVEVEPDALDVQSRTLWSIDGRIDDTLAFVWKP